jgi:hypothetical protein
MDHPYHQASRQQPALVVPSETKRDRKIIMTDPFKVVEQHMPKANPFALIRAAREAGIPIAAACAMIQQESGGANIYGHDVGGTFSTNTRRVTIQGKSYARGADIPVTPSNWSIFMIKVALGEKSNGVGPAQITYAGDLPDGRSGGYFRMMLERGLCPWRPHDNMLFGFEILAANFKRTNNWARAFGHYNGGSTPNMEYGNKVARSMEAWEDWLS